MQPLDIIKDAIRIAPSDADRLLCWFINSFPPAKRQSLYERLSTAIDTARLTGLLATPLPFPSLFTADAAERTWDDLLGHFQQIEGVTERLSPFFRPDGTRFVPHAYPGRWAPVTWNAPLTPAQVRETLGIEGGYFDELVRIAVALVAAEKSGARPQSIVARKQQFAKLGGKLLRVAVLPYADTLPMVTMLYAVSDLVDGIGFGPASFYKQRGDDPNCIWIGDGFFNAGYATNYQLKELVSANLSLASHQVFTSGFTRSVLLRGQFGGPRKIPVFEHLSFVGQLGPDRICVMDRNQSDSVVAQYEKLIFQDSFPISEYLEPIVSWEIPLVLAFAGGLGGYDKAEGVALTVSTDAHLWAASFALNSKVDSASPEFAATSIPTFRRGAWDPSLQNDAKQEDKQSELKWFVPDTGDSSYLMHRLETIVEHFIGQKVREGLEASRCEPDSPALSTAKLLPVARSLLAPLLNAFPTYRGSMLITPPEAWMTKLRGPASYVSYRPSWQKQLKSASGDGQVTEPCRLLEYLKKAA